MNTLSSLALDTLASKSQRSTIRAMRGLNTDKTTSKAGQSGPGPGRFAFLNKQSSVKIEIIALITHKCFQHSDH
jgi:hypothetical protein